VRRFTAKTEGKLAQIEGKLVHFDAFVQKMKERSSSVHYGVGAGEDLVI
jgi:hypothetical protein